MTSKGETWSLCTNLLLPFDVSPSAENYSKLFNFVVGSNLKQHMHSTPSSKTATQIAAKLAHFGKKREVSYARLTKENMQ